MFDEVIDNVFGHRVLLYGPGGIGKSTLGCTVASILPDGKRVAFADADESLDKLKPKLSTAGVALPVKLRCNDWNSMMTMTRADGYDGVGAVVYDTGSVIEQWCINAVLEDNKCKAIEELGGGYGKGYKYVYEKWNSFLSALDIHHIRKGRHVVIIAHDDVKTVPNPSGIDFIRWEPRLQDSKSNSIRQRTHGWADHTLFFAYAVNVKATDKVDTAGLHKKAGRAEGIGLRMLYTAERPYFLAKSRTTEDTFSVENGASPWSEIIK